MIPLTNEQFYLADEIIPDDECQIRPGQIALANTSMFDARHLSVGLSSYVVGGWDRDPVRKILEFYAPSTPVPRKFEYQEMINQQEFVSDENDEDIRTIRGDFKEVTFSGTTANGVTANKGLRSIVDVDEIGAGQTLDRELQNRAMILSNRLLRNDLRRAITGLVAAAVNTNKTWNGTAGQNPDRDIDDRLVAAEDVSGLRPNRVGFGTTAWSKRGSTYEAQDNATNPHAGWMAEQIASFLGVEEVLRNDSRYQNTSSAKEQIVKNRVICFFAAAGLSAKDPSNIKRFVTNTVTGQQLAVYTRQISEKLWQVVVEHYSLLKITYSSGIQLLTIS